MKALQGKASKELFKKYERPVQDPETTMNNIQGRRVAKTVGIDPSEAAEMGWFCELVAKLRLPPEYRRRLNKTKDDVVYFNEQTHQETNEHPSINILKVLFYQKLNNNKAVYTFLDKQRKLLPFVEQKMLRQSIGLNSKRRDAEKANMVRDATGRLIMSKLERIIPDFKAMLTNRSYLLKMLAEKVFIRKELVGKSKRSQAYAALIAAYKQQQRQAQPDKEEEEDDLVDQIDLLQSIYQQAANFYSRQLGNIRQIPQKILDSKDYLESTPQYVLKNILLLNIRKQDIQLYWLARMMDCLPLPPNWFKKRGASFDSYFYEPQKLKFDIHPSYLYVLQQMNSFRSALPLMSPLLQNHYIGQRQVFFFDFFQRKYTVDMYGYIERAQPPQKQQQKQQYAKQDQIDQENANQKGYSKSKLLIQTMKTSDWMILQAVRNISLQMKFCPLLQNLQLFWASLDFWEQPWCPAVSPYGQVVWSSNINSRSIDYNPYKAELNVLTKTALNKMPALSQQQLKPEYRTQSQNGYPNAYEKEGGDDQDQRVIKDKQATYIVQLDYQRQKFLQYYISHLDKPIPYPFSLKESGCLIDQQNYYHQIFTSPFRLDMDLQEGQGEQPALWLQKVRAKSNTIQNTNLLAFQPQNMAEAKEKIREYALAMVSKHEPHLLQETEKRIDKINTVGELVKYLQYVNNIDLREDRKREYQKAMREEDSQSDIFGSELSQVEVVEEEEPHQEEPSQQIQSQRSEQQHQPSLPPDNVSESSSQQQQPQQEIAESEEELIIEQQRRQYQFLKDFPRRKYQTNLRLQLKNSYQLDQLIKNKIKSRTKKSKYKIGLARITLKRQISDAVKILKRASGEFDSKYVKLNMVQSGLRLSNHPYRLKWDRKFGKKAHGGQSDNRSEGGHSDISEYQEFRSQIAQIDREGIMELIEEQRMRRAALKHTQPESRQVTDHQVTKDTIELEPIYQIKPAIEFDPVLRHVKKVGDPQEFRSTFTSRLVKSKPWQASHQRPQQDKQKRTNLENIEKVSLESKQGIKSHQEGDGLRLSTIKKQTNYQSTPARTSSLNKLEKGQERRLSWSRKEVGANLPKMESRPFYRVCLQHTAGHFLEKEAVLRKGDLVSMQARKLLLSKGRGLQTYISKFY